MFDRAAWRWLAIASTFAATAGSAIASDASAEPGGAAQPNSKPRAALLQVRQGATNGVGPEFLGEGLEEASASATHVRAATAAAKPVAALQAAKASGAHAQAAKSRPPAHTMQLMSAKDKDKGKDVLPSVRLEQASAAAEQVLSLFAAGAKAAMKNAAHSETLGWLSSTAEAVHQSAVASDEASEGTVGHASDAAGPPPGAMRFFSDAKRVDVSRPVGQLQRTLLAALDRRGAGDEAPKPEPASMMAMGVASILKGERAEAVTPKRHVDVPAAAAREPLTVQQQRAQLAFLQGLEAQQKEEAARAKELEQQSLLEDAMDTAREAARWD